MDFQSDSNKIHKLLNTEEMTSVEFEEESNSGNELGDEWNYRENDQYGGEAGMEDPYEKDLISIFNKAREFKQRIENMNLTSSQAQGFQKSNMIGGRKINDTIAFMLVLTKKMKDSGKYPDLKQTNFMKISKMILDDAKKQTGLTKIDDVLKEKALKIADNPDPYVAKFRSMTTEKVNAKQGNIRKSVENSRKRFMKYGDKSEKKSWKDSGSNYRNYAQANIWNDVTGTSTKNNESYEDVEKAKMFY